MPLAVGERVFVEVFAAIWRPGVTVATCPTVTIFVQMSVTEHEAGEGKRVSRILIHLRLVSAIAQISPDPDI